MKRTTVLASTAAAVALFAMVGAASAAVTFDPATGEGFVGKGDLHNVFGWNNTTLQKNANSGTFGFTYEATYTYEAVCEWTTGTGDKAKEHERIDEKEISGVNALKEPDPQVKNQITGFKLVGYLNEEPTLTSTAPQVGDICQKGQGGTYTSVELVSSSGELLVNYNGGPDKVIWTALPVE